jgi:hypothetical protein
MLHFRSCATVTVAVLCILTAVAAEQLLFSSQDSCLRVASEPQALSYSQTINCPTSASVSTPARSLLVGCNAYDLAMQRAFDVRISVAAIASSIPLITSYLRTTTYAGVGTTSSQSEVALPANDDVQLMEYDPAVQRLLVVVRNVRAAGGPTLLLKQLDPSATSAASLATVLLDLAGSILGGSAQLVLGLSAWDPVGRRLFALVMTPPAVAGDAATFSVVSTLVPLVGPVAVDRIARALGSSVVSVEGMAWLPTLSRCVVVSYAGAWAYDPDTYLVSPLASVALAFTALASGDPLSSSLAMAAFSTTHVWSSVSTAAVPAFSTTPLPQSALLSAGLVTAQVAASITDEPLLLLINATADSVRTLSVPGALSFAEAAAAAASGAASLLGQQLASARVIVPTPTVSSFAPDTLSAGGGSITIDGTSFSSLPLLSGGSLQCTWSGDAKGATIAALLSSTRATCILPAMSRAVNFLQVQIGLWNESIIVGNIG